MQDENQNNRPGSEESIPRGEAAPTGQPEHTAAGQPGTPGAPPPPGQQGYGPASSSGYGQTGYGPYPPPGYQEYGQGYRPGYGQSPGWAAGPKPPNHLVWAILTTLLCCLPFGVVSIVYAARVDGQWQAGQQQAAEESSKKAKLWAIISAATGGAFLLIYLTIAIFGLAAGWGDTATYNGY